MIICACDVSLCILLEPVLCPFVLCSGGELMMVDHLLCCWPVCTGASDSKQVWANIGSGSPQPGLSSSRVRFYSTSHENRKPLSLITATTYWVHAVVILCTAHWPVSYFSITSM